MKAIYKTKEYRAWTSMRDRCQRENHPAFQRYGGRGIKVCERWNSFENFLHDMGLAPSRDHSLDRIDNSGDYLPENCRWTDRVTQSRNRRRPVYTFQGKTQPLDDWAAELGMNYFTLHSRLAMGWSVEEAFSTPINNREMHARVITYQGQMKPLKQWATELGIDYGRLYRRLYVLGWTPQDAFTTPIRCYNRSQD